MATEADQSFLGGGSSHERATLLSRFFESEVTGLAPWVAAHLHLLEGPLSLGGLRPVRIESRVGPFRLDLLATASDRVGATLPVAIELQLGVANHDHLGKLVTYLAHEGHGVAIWVVDQATHPHLVAVDFLNRSTPDDLAWWLVRYRQDGGTHPDPDHAYVEVLAGPGIPLPASPPEPIIGGIVRSHPTRTEFLDEVLTVVAERSMAMGWRNPRITNKGFAITWGMPAGCRLRKSSIKLRVHAQRAALHLLVQGYDAAGNEAAVERLRERHGPRIAEELPDGVDVEWHGAQKAADSLILHLRGHGWEAGVEAASYVVLSCLGLLRDVVSDPQLVA